MIELLELITEMADGMIIGHAVGDAIGGLSYRGGQSSPNREEKPTPLYKRRFRLYTIFAMETEGEEYLQVQWDGCSLFWNLTSQYGNAFYQGQYISKSENDAGDIDRMVNSMVANLHLKAGVILSDRVSGGLKRTMKLHGWEKCVSIFEKWRKS